MKVKAKRFSGKMTEKMHKEIEKSLDPNIKRPMSKKAKEELHEAVAERVAELKTENEKREKEIAVEKRIKEVAPETPREIMKEVAKEVAEDPKESPNFIYPNEKQMKKNEEEMARDLAQTAKRNEKYLGKSKPHNEYESPEFNENQSSLSEHAEGVKIKFSRGDEFKRFVKSTQSIQDEANLQVRKTGLQFKVMDSSGISMVTSQVPDRYLESYSVKKEGNLGLNLDNLAKIVSDVKKDESVTIETNEDNTKLKIKIKGPKWERETEVPLQDVRQMIEKEPPITHEVEVEIQADALKEALKAANKVSDYITITVEDGKMKFFSKGDAGEYKQEFDAPKTAKEVHARFNIEYLRNFVKASEKNDRVKLYLKTEEPLKIEYRQGNNSARYWIAPYIEN